jgi:hypothetical protein
VFGYNIGKWFWAILIWINQIIDRAPEDADELPFQQETVFFLAAALRMKDRYEHGNRWEFA